MPRPRPEQPDTDEDESIQWEILWLLLEARPDRWWSVEEVVSDTGNPIGALDALGALCDAGLIHRQGRFVFPTRPAIHFFQLVA